MPAPSPTATEAAPDALPQPPLGVVGTGTLGEFTFEVVWDGTDFGITGLELLDGSLGSYLLVSPGLDPVGSCIDETFRLGFGVGVSDTGEAIPNPMPYPIFGIETSNDPTYLHGIAQATNVDVSCYEVVASGTITWTMDPLYPELVVTDSGDTGGARGVVTAEDGVAVSYLVHQGDVFAEVAARFGVSDAELNWLNPRRQDAGALDLKTDETLNLSPSRR